MIGRLIANRYLIEEVCERTPGAISYRAHQLGPDRSVLLRILRQREGTTQDACRRALVAAERAASLVDPHIGRALDVGLIRERFPFVVYEYSKGRSLAALLAEAGTFAVSRLITIGRQLAGALDAAHQAGLLHGELQLHNLWLEGPGRRPDWIRLLGFGLSELPQTDGDGASSGIFRSTGQRETGEVEQLTPRARRSDVHGFGACLYELASGAPPHWSTSPSAGSAWAGLPWTGERAVAHGLSRLIQRCLLPVPDGNYQSFAGVGRDLERLEASAASIASEPPASRPPVTAVHAPAPRARVALGQPKVIVKGG